MTKIDPFIHRKVVVLHQEAPVHQAARAMCDHHIGCVVVNDHQGHLVGMVTDRDLVCHGVEFTQKAEQKIQDVMSKHLVTTDENASIEDVVNIMENYGIRRVPVVRKAENLREICVGIVTLDDLIASRSIDHIRLSRIVQSQIFRRRAPVYGKVEAIRARARSVARSEETLRRFYQTVADEVGLSNDLAESVAKVILSALVQRLHYSGAAHLISQLPAGLQDELLVLPSGPDRTVTVTSVTNDLSMKFGFKGELAHIILGKFWRALQKSVSQGELNHVLAQLPGDFQRTFENRATAA